MNPKHPSKSSSKHTQSPVGPTKNSHVEAGGVTGSQTPPPNIVLDRAGNQLPVSAYDPSKGHAYVGRHKVCPRCLVRLIPQPEHECSFCRAVATLAGEASA